jgi:hypothetical protein
MFSSMRFPAIGEGLKWRFVAGDVGGVLMVVPEPVSAVLLLLGTLLVGTFRKR